jgi:hypothetical protein
MGGSPHVSTPKPQLPIMTAKPVFALAGVSDLDEKNRRLAMSLLTQDWLTPPKLGVSEMQKKQFLGL